MNRFIKLGTFCLLGLVAPIGCQDTTPPAEAPEAPPFEAPELTPGESTPDESAAAEAIEEMPAADETAVDEALAKLSAADRELVAALKVCPVSGEALGSMGEPIKVTVDGKDLFVCCEHCVEPVTKDFETYFAKAEEGKR